MRLIPIPLPRIFFTASLLHQEENPQLSCVFTGFVRQPETGTFVGGLYLFSTSIAEPLRVVQVELAFEDAWTLTQQATNQYLQAAQITEATPQNVAALNQAVEQAAADFLTNLLANSLAEALSQPAAAPPPPRIVDARVALRQQGVAIDPKTGEQYKVSQHRPPKPVFQIRPVR